MKKITEHFIKNARVPKNPIGYT